MTLELSVTEFNVC